MSPSPRSVQSLFRRVLAHASRGVHVDSDEETDERAVSPPLAQLQMGCGPSSLSYANEQEAMLVWATNWGLLSKPTNLPSWLSQPDMETIYRIGAPWGSIAVGRVISRGGDNAPLEQCRRELPHLRFEFEARSELGDQNGNPAWKHILYIYPHAARPPQVLVAMERVVTTIVKRDGGLLGITLTAVINSRTPAKIEVTSIEAGSPTEAAGLHVGDVLVEIEGRPAPQTVQECTERLKAARWASGVGHWGSETRAQTVTVERQRSTNPAMPVTVAVPIPAPVAAVPVAGSTMTLPDKVARIKRALDLDEALSLPAAIKAANEMMNLPDTGGLPAQADALMAALVRLEG